MAGFEIYSYDQCLADQSGQGSVLTFKFTDKNKIPKLIWVLSSGADSRATGNASIPPTASQGIYCQQDTPTPITLETETLYVYAGLNGMATVRVWGYG